MYPFLPQMSYRTSLNHHERDHDSAICFRSNRRWFAQTDLRSNVCKSRREDWGIPTIEEALRNTEGNNHLGYVQLVPGCSQPSDRTDISLLFRDRFWRLRLFGARKNLARVPRRHRENHGTCVCLSDVTYRPKTRGKIKCIHLRTKYLNAATKSKKSNCAIRLPKKEVKSRIRDQLKVKILSDDQIADLGGSTSTLLEGRAGFQGKNPTEEKVCGFRGPREFDLHNTEY